MQKEQMLSAIQQCDPCQDAAWLRAGAEFWPEDVTLSWLLRNPERGGREVSMRNRRWLGVAMLHRHAPARLSVALKAIVLRLARTVVADACERAGRHGEAASLRGLQDAAGWRGIELTCAAAHPLQAAEWTSLAAELGARVEAGAELQVAFDAVAAAGRAARTVNRHREEVELQNSAYADAADGFI